MNSNFSGFPADSQYQGERSTHGEFAALRPGERESYTFALSEGGVEFFDFDEAYFRRLRDHDPSTEEHFFEYFRDLLQIKLRSRLQSVQAVEDVQQETFVRVLAAIRSDSGIREPQKLGSFVNSVCNNVLLEFYRSSARNPREKDERSEVADRTIDLDGLLVSQQICEHVRQVLDRISERDRRLLRAIFLEDKDKNQVCLELGVDREYLRVLLHRAKRSFREAYERTG
jgi:RNA polymerase sigma-70 factor (ECF subfamily)